MSDNPWPSEKHKKLVSETTAIRDRYAALAAMLRDGNTVLTAAEREEIASILDWAQHALYL